MMNGKRRKTLAFPDLSNPLATPGVQGLSGLRFVSRTRTKLDIIASGLIPRYVS